MREILFRGKRVDNGEWVYGDLNQDSDLEIVLINGFNYYSSENGLEREPFSELVLPETVGQYTGLTDKNGTKIFEGDLLKPFDDEFDYMEVVYVNGCFMIEINALQGMMMEYGWDETAGGHGVVECEPFPFYSEDIEVIGNIHDNKEPPEGE